ncbi:hypothetical protein ACLB2K_067797 [Fragaria x ananassa]
MGTEIQSKMYLPGYYSIPTLTSNVGHGGWSLLNENKSLTNGQQYDILLTRPVVDGFHESSKEQVKQMILKHESIFKHQLNELHRLYERQKDLMNEIKRKELLKIQKAAAASQLPLFSSGFPLVGSGDHRPSMSTTAISSQSYCNSIGSTQPTSGVPSQSGVKKLQRRLFNLELPADEYISDGEEPEGVLSGPSIETYPPNRRNEAKVSFNHIGEAFGDNSGALSSGLYLERSSLTRLKEPIQIDKMSLSTDDVYRGVWPFAKKFPENPQLGKAGGVSDMHLKHESNQKEWLTNALNADQTRTSFGGSFGLPDFKKPCEPSKNEARKACEPAKRTLFGIEISDRDLNSSSQASKSDVTTISESPPTWARPPSSLSNNWTSVQLNSLFNTSTHSNRASIMLQQKPEVTRERLLLDCNSRPFTPSLKAELSHQNGVFFRSKFESNELHSSQPSIGGGFPYADSSHSSASKDFTQHGAQSHYSSIGCGADNEFVNRLGNEDTPQGRLHWLKAASVCNGPLASAVDNNSVKVGFVKGDTVHDPTPQMCREKLKTQNDKASSEYHIDLNRCLTEEETRIDVQVPLVVARDVNVGEASEQRICKENFHSSHDGPIRVAAETLVTISSSQAREMQEKAAAHDNATVIDNSLLWFAEIASSNEQNLGQTDNVVKVNGASSLSCDEDSSLDSMDYFEYMTLNLVETELDQCCNVASDNPKEVSLSKRPQRGATRRGRQKKDFQRDVLPGIACLSRNEVTEDLQTFEGSIRASGGCWQSGLSQRNAGKVGGGRGRKRLGTCTLSTTSTVQAAVSQPQMEQQPQCEELQELEERSMAVTGGWGKRTRRPPRQRYLIDSSPVSQNNGMEEFANWRSSVMALHKCIFFLITILGLCLQLKFTTASPFVLDYRNTVLMRLFIIDISTYCGSFGVMIIQTNHSNTNFGEFMNNISLLLGTLASVLELLILFPPFGWVTLFFWSICFVTPAIKSYQYSKTLCESAVAALVVTLGEFQVVKLMKGSLMGSSAVLGRAYDKFKDLIKRRRSSADHDETKDQSKELPV